MNKYFKRTRYDVKAKRKDTNEKFTEWTSTNSLEEAERHAKRIEELGYLSQIIDKGATDEV